MDSFFLRRSPARQEFHHHRHVAAIILAVLAVTVGPLWGVVWPRAIKPVFVGWMVLAYPIGWTVSRIVLSIIFYGLFTPVACVFRIMGRDALGLRMQPAATSYWRAKPSTTDKSRYLRQF